MTEEKRCINWYGLKFVPTDRKLSGCFKEDVKHTSWVTDPRLTVAGKWNYDWFYETVKKNGFNSNTDIFTCLNDGKNYVPGSNMMFEYI